MLVLVLIAVIICAFATYLTEYNKNKVTATDVITAELGENYEEVSNDEFLANFETFDISLTNYIKPWDNGGTLEKGTKTFTIVTKANENSKIRGKIKVTIGLGANWIGYKSVTVSKTFEVGASNITLNITDITDDFPMKGKLWFTKVEQPTLYVLVEWSEVLNTKPYRYTFLEYDYNDYK